MPEPDPKPHWSETPSTPESDTRSQPLGRFAAASVAVLTVAGVAYWFGTRNGDEQNDPAVAQADGQQIPDSDEASGNNTQPPDKSPAGNGKQGDDAPKNPRDELDPETADPPLPEEPVAAPDPPAAPVADSGPQTIRDGPWKAGLAGDAGVLTFQQSAYLDAPGPLEGEVAPDELKQWLEPVPGHPHNFAEAKHQNRRYTAIDGYLHLKAPWPTEAVLRLGLFEFGDFSLHFVSEGDVLTLRYHRHEPLHKWAAYRSRRKDERSRPDRLQLLTSDDGRFVRGNSGVLDIHHDDGRLIVTRGNVRLLTAPLAGRPEAVFFEGPVKVSEISMHLSEAPPPAGPDQKRVVFASDRPAELDWNTRPESTFARTSDGGVRLTAGTVDPAKPFEEDWSGVKLPRRGLYEVIVRVDNPQPGTGVYLGDENAQPAYRVVFLHDEASQQTIFDYGWTTAGDFKHNGPRSKTSHNAILLSPFAGERQWLKIVLGYGGMKISTSGDGEHWGVARYVPERAVTGTFASVGLFAVREAGAPPRSIALSHLEVRELSAVTSLARDVLRPRLPQIQRAWLTDVPTWRAAVLRTRPSDVSASDWTSTFAVRTLEFGVNPSLAHQLLNDLFDESLRRNLTPDERFRLLDEIALASDLFDSNQRNAIANAYDRTADVLAQAGEAGVYRRTIDELLRASVWSDAPIPLVPRTRLTRGALQNIYAANWNDALSYCVEAAHWMQSAHPDLQWRGWDQLDRELLDWTATVAGRSTSDENVRRLTRAAAPGTVWRPPLESKLSKEAFNVIAEFNSVLRSEAWEDAGRIIYSGAAGGAEGLLPDPRDSRLLASLPRLVAAAMRDHPELQQTMRAQYGDAGRLRVRRAITQGDASALESATVQLYGTDAAAEAHLALGDRATAVGRFEQAILHYRRARDTGTDVDKEAINPRLRLAAAMLGRDAGDAPVRSVELGGETFDPQTFESLIADLKSSRAPDAGTIPHAAGVLGNDAPKPAVYKAQPKGQFGSGVGNNANGYGPQDVDWAGRQIAVARDVGRMYVSNRFQVVAYDVNSGGQTWSAALGGEQGNAHDWPYVEMRPVVAVERLFVRRLTKQGVELACMNKADGKVVWNVRPDQQVASDPVLVRNRPTAVIVDAPQAGVVSLSLAAFDAETGEVVKRTPLLKLRDEWSARPPTTLTAAEGRILVTAAACTACCNLDGEVLWIRGDAWFPRRIDREWQRREVVPPVVDDGKIYLHPPGTCMVCRLDLETGRVDWRRPVPEIRRLLGKSGEAVVVQTFDGVEAYSAVDGRALWRTPVDDLLHASLCGDEGGVLCSRRIEIEKDRRCPALLWIDVRTGAGVAQTMFENLADAEPRFGPLIPAGDRMWAFYGRGWKDPNRELIELLRTNEPALPPERG